MSKKLMLVDGHSILNRAFFGIPDLTNAEGIHTNAMYGFLNILFKFLDEEKPDYLVIAFDVSAPTFRHEKYAAYKGTRKPMAAELKQQVPLMKDVLRSMNISLIEKAGYEADDLIGTLAKKYAAAGIDVSVISGDRDLLQLAEPHIKIRIPKTKKGITEVEDYLPEDVKALYGVTPLEFIDVKALMGDSSDNIPGAPGVGPKTASALIAKYHSLDNVFAHMDELKPPKARESIRDNEEQVRMSRFLAEIDVHAAISHDLEEAQIGQFFNPDSYELFKKYNFKSLLKRFDLSSLQLEHARDITAFFQTVTDLSEAEQLFEKAAGLLADGNRIGLSILAEAGTCYGICCTLDEEHCCYFPVQGFLQSDYLLDKIRHLASLCSKRQIILNQVKRSLVLFQEITGTAFADPSLAGYLLNPSTDSYSYDALAQDFLHTTYPSRTELLGKATLQEAVWTQEDAVRKLACMDSYISYRVWPAMQTQLEQEEMFSLFDAMEMPLLFVLSDMEKAGIRVNKEALAVYGEQLQKRILVLEQEIYQTAGEEFNINSPKQLGILLFEKLQLPNAKKTKSGYSTAADVLEKLAPAYPIVSQILEYRQLTKLKSTYADGLAGYIDGTGRIHSHFNQTITATGRISSTDPNLQNIPIRMELGRQIRKVFIPADDFVFLDADYSQIELRIMAHMSGDRKLIEAYRSAQDIHRITASQVFHVPFEEVTPLQRRNAKAVNFGIIYGISSFGLSQDLSISRKEAAGYIDQYFKTYPDVKVYIDSLVAFAKDKGYSLTMFQRRRPIPELKSSNFMQRSFGERVAMNAPIQGTAADIIKIAMIRVHDRLKAAGLQSRLLLQVHDELLVETQKDEIEQVRQILTESMKHAADLLVPLEIDLKQGDNWMEAH